MLKSGGDFSYKTQWWQSSIEVVFQFLNIHSGSYTYAISTNADAIYVNFKKR